MALGFAAGWLIALDCFFDDGQVILVNSVLAAVSPASAV